MRLDFNNERVLAIVAHPDDAELLCAGTLARAKTDGAAIGVCVLCQGDKGQPDPPTENLADIRRREMQAAVGLLGAELLEGGFCDGELFDGNDSRKVIIELVRRFRPSLILSHAKNDYHADHRAASQLSEAASWLCASRGYRTDSTPLPCPPAVWWMDTIEMTGFEPHFCLDITDHLDLKRQMLRCHESQLARGSQTHFAPLEELMQRQAEARGAQFGVRAAEAFRQHMTWKRCRAW